MRDSIRLLTAPELTSTAKPLSNYSLSSKQGVMSGQNLSVRRFGNPCVSRGKDRNKDYHAPTNICKKWTLFAGSIDQS